MDSVPGAGLLRGGDDAVVDRHGPLDRLADGHHDLLLVLLLHLHLLGLVPHGHLDAGGETRLHL